MEIDYFKIPEIKIFFKDNYITTQRDQVHNSKDIVELFRSMYDDNVIQHHEEMYAIYFNSNNRVLGFTQIAEGGISGVTIDIRIILQYALLTNASGLIISHNHPSGQLKPSQTDISFTAKLKEACKTMDLILLDHIILSDCDYYSFSDNDEL